MSLPVAGMSFRGLRLAAQFLTRLPVPGVTEFSPLDLARSATWFPFVGLVLGGIVALVTFALGHRSAGLAGVVGVLSWVWLTGAMHLDGLAKGKRTIVVLRKDKLLLCSALQVRGLPVPSTSRK